MDNGGYGTDIVLRKYRCFVILAYAPPQTNNAYMYMYSYLTAHPCLERTHSRNAAR